MDLTIHTNGIKRTFAGEQLMHSVSISHPNITSTIAVEMRNVHCDSRFMGHFSNGQVTDNSWKCSRQWEQYWWSPTFNESYWYPSQEVKENATSSFANVKEISSNAKWIGMKGVSTLNGTLYCRKLLNKIFLKRVNKQTQGYCLYIKLPISNE